MQKNLGYVIPSLVIPDATNGIGYWYLGNVPLGVRATGTMWTIGADHYWYVDNTKTNYLAEIPVEEYNAQLAALLESYGEDWDAWLTGIQTDWSTWLTGVQSDWSTFFNTQGAAFTLWFNRMKNQLTTDAAGNLQAQIDAFCYNFAADNELYTISSQAYPVGHHIVWQNRYCEVISAIAQGDTLSADSTDPNRNLMYVDVDTIIGALPDAIRQVDVGLPPTGVLTFNADGSITNTFSATENIRTVFNSDGSISNIYTNGGIVIERKTVFNSNGSISVVEVPQT